MCGTYIKALTRRVLGTLRSTWQSIPPHLKFDAARQKHDLSRGAILLQSLRQEYLYTEFVLHTILANFSEEGRVSLIKTAHEVLNLVLLPTRKRDLLQSNRAEMEWTVSGIVYEYASTSRNL